MTAEVSVPTSRIDALTAAPAEGRPRHGVASAERAIAGAAQRPAAAAALPQRKSRLAATVLVASGNAASRARWKRAVLEPDSAAEADGIGVVREALSARQPAVLLLDAALPGLGGPAGLSALRQLSQDVRVIVLGGFGSDREELAFVRAGARACCDTAISLVLLARAIEAVLRGEVWIRRALTGSLVTELAALEAATGAAIANRRCSTPVPGGGAASLTARERQIASLLARGDSNQAIAHQLSISERTVTAHASRIFRKSGAVGRAGLAQLFGDQRTG